MAVKTPNWSSLYIYPFNINRHKKTASDARKKKKKQQWHRLKAGATNITFSLPLRPWRPLRFF